MSLPGSRQRCRQRSRDLSGAILAGRSWREAALRLGPNRILAPIKWPVSDRPLSPANRVGREAAWEGVSELMGGHKTIRGRDLPPISFVEGTESLVGMLDFLHWHGTLTNDPSPAGSRKPDKVLLLPHGQIGRDGGSTKETNTVERMYSASGDHRTVRFDAFNGCYTSIRDRFDRCFEGRTCLDRAHVPGRLRDRQVVWVTN